MADGGGGGNGGGGFDPCECVWSHEDAMRRLISLLRSSQGYCTSDECFQDLPGPVNPSNAGGEDTFFMFMIIWIVVAMLLYFLRPASLFGRNSGDDKPSNNQGPQQPPPDNLAQ